MTAPDPKEPHPEHKVTVKLKFHGSVQRCGKAGFSVAIDEVGLGSLVQLSQSVVLDNRPQNVV